MVIGRSVTQQPILDLNSSFNRAEFQFGNKIRIYDGRMQWWERLAQQIEELGWSKAELARRASLSYDSVNKYLRGDVDSPRGDVMQRLADTIGKPRLWLQEGMEGDLPEVTLSDRRLATAILGGVVEAGTWREVDEFDQSEPTLLALPPDIRFPHARQTVYDVSGDSMNDLLPDPIKPGSRIICVNYDDIAGAVKLRDGLVVVVQRTREGGHIREISVKQLEFYEDRVEFHPRSTNPKHKPIVVSHDAWSDSGTTVEILALVRQIINEMAV